MKSTSYYSIVLSVFAVGLIVVGIVVLGVVYCENDCSIPIGAYLILGGVLLHLWLNRHGLLVRKNSVEDRRHEINTSLSDKNREGESEQLTSEYDEMVTELDRRLERLKASEQMFSSVIEASPTGMLIINELGNIVLVNNVIESMFGWSNEELIGQKVEVLVPDGVRAMHPKQREDFLKEGTARAMGVGREVNGQRRDGSLFTAELGLNPLKTVDGVFVVASVLNITSRLEGERLLYESEERLSLALSGSGEGLWDWEIQKGTFFWSAEYTELLDVDRSTLLPETDLFEERLHPGDREEVIAARSKHLTGGERFNMDCRLRKENGLYIWINVRGCTFRSGTGKPIRMAGTVRDINARKQAEDELKTSMSELSYANKELQNFAYITSHDLREPLRAISSFVQLLKADYGDQLDKDANEYMDFAISGAKRLQSMILSLMTYSQVDTEIQSLTPLPLSKPIFTAIRELRLRIEETGTIIDMQDAFPRVQGNADQLTQLFQNLITNAIKFQKDKSPCIQITHKIGRGLHINDRLQVDCSYCVVSVKDNGIGVAPEDHERIFSMFQRLHAVGKYQGAGIGLALCSKIVTRHKGLLWIESEEGEGSIFHLALPLAE